MSRLRQNREQEWTFCRREQDASSLRYQFLWAILTGILAHWLCRTRAWFWEVIHVLFFKAWKAYFSFTFEMNKEEIVKFGLILFREFFVNIKQLWQRWQIWQIRVTLDTGPISETCWWFLVHFIFMVTVSEKSRKERFYFSHIFPLKTRI